MEFSVKQIKIKSSWLDWKDPIFNKIDYEHFYLYLSMYRFMTHKSQENDTFIASLGLLRKETGYSTDKVFNLLKDLNRYRIIKVDVSRWDYFKNEETKSKYNDTAIFVAHTLDKPNLKRVFVESKSKWQDEKVTDDDFYISINTSIIDYYRELHTETKNSKLRPNRLITFYCILNKYNNAEDNKMNMSILKMAKAIGFSKTYVNDLIEEMNLNGLLRSQKVATTNNREGFEHVVAQSLDTIQEFKKELETSPNQYQKKLIRKHESKNKADTGVINEEGLNTLDEDKSLAKEVSSGSQDNYNPFFDIENEWGTNPHNLG